VYTESGIGFLLAEGAFNLAAVGIIRGMAASKGIKNDFRWSLTAGSQIDRAAVLSVMTRGRKNSLVSARKDLINVT
jgi:hypothetical protein